MKTKTKEVLRVKMEPITEMPELILDHAAAKYIRLRQAKKELTEELDDLSAEIRRTMTARGLAEAATPHGSFRLEERVAMDWEVRDLKVIFKDQWESFVQCDKNAVKAKMGLQGPIYERLTKKAIRTSTVALTLK